MCIGCWREAKAPKVVNEKTKKVADLIVRMYEEDGCGVGGYCHIVTDDWNLEDHSIDFCLNESNSKSCDWVSEEGRLIGIEILNLMKSMSMEERYSALAIADGYVKVNQL